ncbi:MAG: sugar phosphate isomerase/epimerase family protein [Spirochaetota bacterium]
MIGVSPAYFLSLFSPNFTPVDIEQSLERIRKTGFQSLQLETFTPAQVSHWDADTCRRLSAALAAAGLTVSQFVAHHLLPYFASVDGLRSTDLSAEFRKVLRIAEQVHPGGIVTIPQPWFELPQDKKWPVYSALWSLYLDSLHKLRNMAAEAGFTLAVEVLPGSLLGSSEGFLRMTESLGAPYIGLNLDTGHAWACKEKLELIPLKAARYICGTHLADNAGNENLSLSPGQGTIPWDAFFHACRMAGFNGPFDVEIRCTPEEVDAQYSAAYQFLSQYTIQQLEV